MGGEGAVWVRDPGKVRASFIPDLGGVAPMQGIPEAPEQSCRNQGIYSVNKLSVVGEIYVNIRMMSL